MAKYINHTQSKTTATKRFADRKKPQAVFREALEESQERNSGKIRVINFHGLGGIGKTELIGELEKTLNRDFKDCEYILFDFDTVVDCGDTLEILRSIEQILKTKYNFDFPFFDLVAYTYETKLGKLATRPELGSVINSNRDFNFLRDVVDEIPFVNTISKIIKFAEFAEKGKNLVKERLENRKFKNQLAEVDRKSAQDIKKELGYYFALDLNENTAKLNFPFVVFLDTYELLVNEFTTGVPLDNDLFLRGDKGVITNTKNVLWVISGREQLKWIDLDPTWEGSLEQHKVGKLSSADAKWFLNEAGIREDDLVEGIYELTKGVPVYLDACVDVYYNIKDTGCEPKLDDFGHDNKSLMNRFCTYMNDLDKDFIIFLAFLDSWTDENIEEIATKKIGTFSPTQYQKIKDFSVISHEGARYFVCAEVKSVLIANAPKTLRDKFKKVEAEKTLETLDSIKKSSEEAFSDYVREQNLKQKLRPAYNDLRKTTGENQDTVIMRQYLAPDAIEIASLVRKGFASKAAQDLLKYFIRFHAPSYDKNAYTVNEWEEIKAVTEKCLPSRSLYLAKLYADCPAKYSAHDYYLDLANQIILDYKGDEHALLAETILVSCGKNAVTKGRDNFSPYGIHSLVRLKTKFSRMNNEIIDIDELVKKDAGKESSYAKLREKRQRLNFAKISKFYVLPRTPELLNARILRLLLAANGEALGADAQFAIFTYALDIKDFVHNTTSEDILIGYAEIIFSFLGGVDNLPLSKSIYDTVVFNRAIETLREIRPRYEEVFGKDAEIVVRMICYTRKHQIYNDYQSFELLISDIERVCGLNSDAFSAALRLVSIEFYNNFSESKILTSDNHKIFQKITELTKKYLAVREDDYTRKGYQELSKAFYEKFPDKKVEPSKTSNARKPLASDNSSTRAHLEAEALKLQEQKMSKSSGRKNRFKLFRRK